MLVKKSALSLCACNSVFASNCYQRVGDYSSTSYISRANRRAYATVNDNSPQPDGKAKLKDAWPEPRHPHKVPTPYQILDTRRGDVYSKQRFNELVKLYHPDRTDYQSHTPLCHSIPRKTRLERYHLIIAAHAILSDPSKRKAYDTFGAGWGLYESVTPRNSGGDTVPTHGPDSAMGNATWEDWERWYRRQEGHDGRGPPPQSPHFISNTAFVGLIFLLAGLGGIGQAARADLSTKSIMKIRNETHEQASRDLTETRAEAMNWTKAERIDMFLKTRDPEIYQDEEMRRLLTDPDVCGDGIDRHQEADFRRDYKSTNIRTGQAYEDSDQAGEPP